MFKACVSESRAGLTYSPLEPVGDDGRTTILVASEDIGRVKPCQIVNVTLGRYLGCGVYLGTLADTGTEDSEP